MQTIYSFLSDRPEIQPVKSTHVRHDSGLAVEGFSELVEKVAELSYRNPDFVLFFRGQSQDWKNRKGNSTLKPSLFRPERSGLVSPSNEVLANRYARLQQAEELLVDELRTISFSDKLRFQRYRILRWSVLQHYEICPTPLLDITHSLRVAASFASLSAVSEALICVLALPSLSGSVTTSAEQGVQVVRLLSICPPSARRPHFQEGYLVGEYPELISIQEKGNYRAHEIDLGLRLIGKFRISPSTFWHRDPRFSPIPRDALYPDDGDRFAEIAARIQDRLVVFEV